MRYLVAKGLKTVDKLSWFIRYELFLLNSDNNNYKIKVQYHYLVIIQSEWVHKFDKPNNESQK